jgi:hypothetical protein
MTTPASTLIGHLTEVRGNGFVARLLAEGKGFQPLLQVGSEQLMVGQIGGYAAVRQGGVQVVTIVSRTWQEDAPTDANPDRFHRFVALTPVGQITEKGRFQAGVHRFPTTEAEVHLMDTGSLNLLFENFQALGFDVGHLPSRPDAKVYLDPSPMFGRHLAILGQSGAGKSWTVASVLQRVIEVLPKAHIVMLDLHGEYAWKDAGGRIQTIFAKPVARYVDARELEIPYWLLTFAELADLLIDRGDPRASVQLAFLREVVYTLRKKANTDLGMDRLSVDSPVYFNLTELYLHFKKANEQQLDFGKTKGALYGQFDEFLIKLQSKLNDARYDFLFRPKTRTESSTLTNLLRDFVGLGQPRAQVTIVDLSPIPSDVRPTVSAQIGRLAFEFNYWNPRFREFPLLLVCEEAHAYIPRERGTGYEGTRRSMERIAKEGRKYGVGLAVVSQRPNELSETVLAQCGNFICLRITNPDDQAYVRRLVPEGSQDLTDILSSLGRGEALVLGECTPLPTRVQMYRPSPTPNSQDADFYGAWRAGPDDLDVKGIVTRWWQQVR